MCTGAEIALISGAASGAGGLYNANLQNQAIAETNTQNKIRMDIERKARDAEVARQAGMEATSAEQVAQALLGANPEDVVADVAAQAADPMNKIVQSAEIHNTPVLQGQVQNTDVTAAIDEKVSGRLARTKEMLKNMAIMSGQGTSTGAIGDLIGRSGSEIQTIGSKRRGSLGASQLETSIPAAEVTKSKSMLGDLLMLAGQAGGSYGGQMAGAAGTPLFTNPFARKALPVTSVGDIMAGGLY